MRLIASSLLLCLMTVTGAGGCGRIPLSTPAAPDIKALTGSWQGWLVTERDFTLARFDIHEDGTFEVTGPRIRATGRETPAAHPPARYRAEHKAEERDHRS